MPLFEFVCADCSRPFEELVRSASAVSEVTCPTCGSSQVNKKISTFASRLSGGGSFSLGANSAALCSTGGT
jgi:putative FmdB family regulatory protein